MVRAKLCGVTRGADIRAVAAAGADAVGVVSDVDVETPREVAPRRAAELVADAPPFLTTVLVTMPGDAERAVEVAGVVRPDAVQIHGDLAPDALGVVRRETGARVLAAVDAADPDRARDLAPAADALLLDSTTESGAGGTGRTHDWAAAADLVAELPTPVVLAGGLTPDNVAEAVRTVDPYAVDVASGVEREGGVKDHDAVRAFLRAVREGEAAERGVGA